MKNINTVEELAKVSLFQHLPTCTTKDHFIIDIMMLKNFVKTVLVLNYTTASPNTKIDHKYTIYMMPFFLERGT